MDRHLKILIIASDLGNTAPGIVFRTLLDSFCKLADCTVIAPINASNCKVNANMEIIECIPYSPSKWDVTKYRWIKYKRSLKDEYWAVKVFIKSFLKVIRKKYDCVLSLTSMNYFAPLKLGRCFSRILRLKWTIYSVDGIPSPVEWMDDAVVHSIMADALDRTCRKADVFMSSNPYMMEYQKTVFRSFHGRWGFIFTPCLVGEDVRVNIDHKGKVFLYAGNIYGLRRINGLVDGFRRFLLDIPCSKLIFVGNFSRDYFKEARDLVEDGRIELLPFTDDLSSLYGRADVLVDIGADIPNDVFLSSKVVSYLPLTRPILAISGENSPIRGIMGNTDSIIHAYNNGEDVYRGMKQASCCTWTGDRDELIELFSPNNIAIKLEAEIRILFS